MSKTSEFIRTKRESLGLTQAELARKVGVFESEVRMWERGMLPDSKYLLKLADALQVEADEILRGEEECAPQEVFDEGAHKQHVHSSGQELAQEVFDERTHGQDVHSSGQDPAQEARADLQEPQPDTLAAQPDSPSDDAGTGRKQTQADDGGTFENLRSEGATDTTEGEPLPEQGEESGNIGADDPLSEDDFLFDEPLMRNGFTKTERILGYTAGAVFILIVLLNIISSVVGYVGRDRTLTTENYNNYIEIDSNPVGNVNIDTVEITVTFKAHVSDFMLSLTLTFPEMLGSVDYVTDISFSQNDCEKGEVLIKQIALDSYMYSPFAQIQVNSVSGGLD